jgi:diguanylate cyclase (GGDEF)-like protein
MTTDRIKEQEISKAAEARGNGKHFGRANGSRKFFSAAKPSTSFGKKEEKSVKAENLLTLLKEKEREQAGQERFLSATMSLLQQANEMIERAEEKLSAQENRIVQLENLTTTDELTNLQNRRGFYQTFTRELDRCVRGQSQGGLLVLIDLDNFKHINDTYGHLAGDAALRLVARTLNDTIRLMDVAARLGGDEFVLLLSNTTKKDAASRGQDLARQLNNLSLAWYGQEIPVRASVGFRSYKAGDKAEKVFNEADIELYTNKRQRAQGRTNNLSTTVRGDHASATA